MLQILGLLISAVLGVSWECGSHRAKAHRSTDMPCVTPLRKIQSFPTVPTKMVHGIAKRTRWAKMFPTAHSVIYRNEEGEVLGWDNPSPTDEWYDPDEYMRFCPECDEPDDECVCDEDD